jgi:hypothetical protein
MSVVQSQTTAFIDFQSVFFSILYREETSGTDVIKIDEKIAKNWRF